MQSSILGIGYESHLVMAFTALKLVTNRYVPSGLDTNIEGELKSPVARFYDVIF